MADFESRGPGKRRKLNSDSASSKETSPEPRPETARRSQSTGLGRPISPPLSRRVRSRTPVPSSPRVQEQRERKEGERGGDLLKLLADDEGSTTEEQEEIRVDEGFTTEEEELKEDETVEATIGDEETTEDKIDVDASKPDETECKSPNDEPQVFLPSPIQLTRINDLSPTQNVDTVTLTDILSDPLIKECWNFNYLFDIDFVMKHFDPDVRRLVKVKIVHGFWKKEDERRIGLQEAAEPYQNVELINAYIPDPFGTHHSKMLVLFRHDDTAQVVIHTANMIERDWGNMTQAVWRSSNLPLLDQSVLDESTKDASGQSKPQPHLLGSGERFKTDILRYFEAYGKRLKGLTTQLIQYDFSPIRAAFIGSAPSRQKLTHSKPSLQTSWGWLGLREILSRISVCSTEGTKSAPNVIIQISSIATLGATPTWLTHFQSVLSKHSSSTATVQAASQGASFFDKKGSTKTFAGPTFHIIFPTAHEIRTSLDGYHSGASIHMKLQSAAQQKQLQYLRPLMCHWKIHGALEGSEGIRKAERGAAAPHIKTYIRFSDSKQESIDWAMVTSANLSKQAWGEVENKNGEIWIQSWEAGVVVWPALFADSSEKIEMVPVFGKDTPTEQDLGTGQGQTKALVGFRMAYDLPLESYASDEVPWCATAAHQEPDWKGLVWRGY